MPTPNDTPPNSRLSARIVTWLFCRSRIPNFSITQPNALTVSVIVADATCNHSDGNATVNPSGGTIPYTYNWSNGDSNQSANNLSAGNYSVNVTDANGCSASASAAVDTVSMGVPICMATVDSTSSKNIIVWEKPTANLPIDSFRIYREVSSVFVPVATVPYSSVSTFTDTTVGVNPNTTSYRYEISAIDSCGLESALSLPHKTMHLSVSLANPPASFNLIWNDYIGYSVTNYRILRAINNPTYIAVDSTSFGNTLWSDTATFSATDTVSYIIEVKHPSGCYASIKNPTPFGLNLNSSKSNIYKIMDSTLTFMENKDEDEFIKIYPNPNLGIFTLEISNEWSGGEVKIFNLLGENIYESAIRNNKSEIDLGGYAKGIYHLQLRTGYSVVNKKIIVQ